MQKSARTPNPTCGATLALPDCGGIAEALNNACFCISLDRDRLRSAIEAQLGDPGLFELLSDRCPHVFADRPVFVAASQLHRMAEVIRAVQEVVSLPGWREHALASAPPIARHDSRGAQGMFFGYDFHLNGDALGLIEINTNAGGAMLNAMLARAQRACCRPVEPLLPAAEDVEGFERAMVAMFRSEWGAANPQRPLRCVAIVDEAPEQQYLYPEFLLFKQLLERHRVQALIADPAALTLSDGVLRHGGTAVDLVYNRLTDFYLQTDRCAVLREAYLQEAIVLSPHPQAHALYADKRRLAALTDPDFLAAIGVPQGTRELLLREVPRTVVVDEDNAARLWSQRRDLFFKPVSGFGGRAAYRGEKLTKRVWQEILAGGYVAQALVAPGERRIDASEGGRAMKFDLRHYVYDGRIQWVAARLYQGQTTNFRTEGGGFAPVFSTESPAGNTACPCPRPAAHASCTFLLDDAGGIHPLPHPLYVALARGEGAVASLASRTFRLADWYVQLREGKPERVVNEWYGWVRFDEQGCFQPAPEMPQRAAPAPGAIDTSALPTAAEREQMSAQLFSPQPGGSPPAGDGSTEE